MSALQPETTLELRSLYDKYVMGFFGLPNPLPTARFGKALKVRIVQQVLLRHGPYVAQCGTALTVNSSAASAYHLVL